MGLAFFDSGDQPSALSAFQHAAEADPTDADSHYYVGTIDLGQRDYDHAIAEFEKALAINPLHASAQYGFARALQRSGKTDEARKHLQRFQEITQKKIGTVFSDNYGEQGRYARAQDMLAPPASVPAMIPVTFAMTASGTSDSRHNHASPPAEGAGACMLDMEGNGQIAMISMQSGANAIQAYRMAQDGSMVGDGSEADRSRGGGKGHRLRSRRL